MDRAFLAQAGVQGAVEFLDHVHGGHTRGHLGEGCKGIQHVGKVAVGKRVVQVPAELRGVLRRRARQRHQRDVFGTCTGDAVEGGKLAHAIGGEQAADAFLAGIAIGGIGGVELVAGADEADALGGLDLLEEAQVEVTGHADDFSNADGLEAVQDEITNGGLHERVLSICFGRRGASCPAR